MPSHTELAAAGLLGRRQAEAYVLREIEGFDRHEAARAMGIEPTTVDSHLQDAKAKIERARRTIELIEASEVTA